MRQGGIRLQPSAKAQSNASLENRTEERTLENIHNNRQALHPSTNQPEGARPFVPNARRVYSTTPRRALLGSAARPKSFVKAAQPSSSSNALGYVPATKPPPPEPPVPIVFEGTDEQCSICTEEFLHSERCTRLVCGHCFHASCWQDCIDSELQRPSGPYRRHARLGEPARFTQELKCPNCRGAGNIIAVWKWIDPRRVTQFVNDQLEQAPNLLSTNEETPDPIQTSQTTEIPVRPPSPRTIPIRDPESDHERPNTPPPEMSQTTFPGHWKCFR